MNIDDIRKTWKRVRVVQVLIGAKYGDNVLWSEPFMEIYQSTYPQSYLEFVTVDTYGGIRSFKLYNPNNILIEEYYAE